MVFADDTELELAKEAYPGKKFQAGTLTTLNAAAAQLGGVAANSITGRMVSTEYRVSHFHCISTCLPYN